MDYNATLENHMLYGFRNPISCSYGFMIILCSDFKSVCMVYDKELLTVPAVGMESSTV